ncbi:MAG: hypothetical protein ACI9GM_000967 [Salibacteraceae bacterium]
MHQNYKTMSKNTSPSTDDEIDLGQLFNLIGKGFGKIVGLITGIFNFGWNTILHILLFFVKHAWKFSVAIVVGAVIGFIIDYKGDPEYEGTMVVEPNFGSGQQLYENIAYYNSLTEQGDTVKLGEVFGITPQVAAYLVSFEIEAIVNENQILSTYDDYLRKLDSVTALSFEFETYKDNFFPYNYSRHSISVISKKRDIFTSLGDSIIGGVINNPYYKRKQDAEFAIIDQTKAFYDATLQDVDTLRKVYLQTMMLQAKKANSQGTTISLAENQPAQTKELSLFETEAAINSGITDLKRSEVSNAKIIDVISELPSVGFKKDRILDKSSFRFSVMAFIGLLVFLTWMELAPVLRKFN